VVVFRGLWSFTSYLVDQRPKTETTTE
jgi:hypothetical protein